MTAGSLLADIKAAAVRWSKLVTALLWHDPIFRYAAIAAAFALFFLFARVAQELAGPGAITPAAQTTSQGSAGSGRDRIDDAVPSASALDEKPPPPGSATPSPGQVDAPPLAITPGRSLENLEVEPAPRDSFGTLPQGEPQK